MAGRAWKLACDLTLTSSGNVRGRNSLAPTGSGGLITRPASTGGALNMRPSSGGAMLAWVRGLTSSQVDEGGEGNSWDI